MNGTSKITSSDFQIRLPVSLQKLGPCIARETEETEETEDLAEDSAICDVSKRDAGCAEAELDKDECGSEIVGGDSSVIHRGPR